ncbi:MAG: polyprenyl synthetase family protein [Desulfobacterota bacterium]|nr:polyprenyl synthetase family protein [Thermodesulfobacteriota bacterium]MDW8001660.1 polyprenyl synthetase family protein [Deltaproteobacteria bacterium]
MDVIREELGKFEKFILKSMSSNVPFIDEVSKYVMGGGGKRIRPALVILSARVCNYRGRKTIPYAAIVELIHTATLLHDDVLDNAKIRRGRPSVNELWGNEQSVLLGDFFYSKAVEIVSKYGDKEVIRIISRATTEVTKGEILEVLRTGDLDLKEEEYFEIVGFKTASLFGAACEMGALLAKKGKDTRETFRRFGEKLGFAFQLTDDVLDYVSEERTLGKKIGTDLKERKVTLPLILALKSSTKAERRMVELIFKKTRINSKDFLAVKDFIEKRNGFIETYKIAKTFIEEAKDCIKGIPFSPYKESLLKLCDLIPERKS